MTTLTQDYEGPLDREKLEEMVYEENNTRKLTSFPSLDYDTWTDMLRRLGALETFEQWVFFVTTFRQMAKWRIFHTIKPKFPMKFFAIFAICRHLSPLVPPPRQCTRGDGCS